MRHVSVPLRGGATEIAIGIETRGGVLTVLIEAGTAVPCELTTIFTTADDGQATIKIKALRGDGGELGRYELVLNENAPRGVPEIRVTFAVGSDGGFRISARDGDDREVHVRVT